MAAVPRPLPPPNFPWTDLKTGQPTQPFAEYMANLDFRGAPVQLINAANDAAAAAAGVPVGNLYRNGSVLQIRVT